MTVTQGSSSIDRTDEKLRFSFRDWSSSGQKERIQWGEQGLSTGRAVCGGRGATRLDPGWCCPRVLWDSQAPWWGPSVTGRCRAELDRVG